MLFFLSIAAQRGFVVDSYRDHAVGTMDKDADGMIWMTKIALRPAIVFSLTPPTAARARRDPPPRPFALLHRQLDQGRSRGRSGAPDMYMPSHFERNRLDALHGLVAAHPLGTLVTHSAPTGLDADHIPFELAAPTR